MGAFTNILILLHAGIAPATRSAVPSRTLNLCANRALQFTIRNNYEPYMILLK